MQYRAVCDFPLYIHVRIYIFEKRRCSMNAIHYIKQYIIITYYLFAFTSMSCFCVLVTSPSSGSLNGKHLFPFEKERIARKGALMVLSSIYQLIQRSSHNTKNNRENKKKSFQAKFALCNLHVRTTLLFCYYFLKRKKNCENENFYNRYQHSKYVTKT